MGIFHEDLFNNAASDVRIVSGELGARNSLHPSEYLKAITAALDRGVSVTIVAGYLLDKESPLIDYLRKEDRIKLFKLPYRFGRPMSHFRIRDYGENGKEGELFIEEFHEFQEPYGQFYETKNPRVLREYDGKFSEILKESVPASISDFRISE